MGVWDHLGDFDLLGRLLSHPAQPAVSQTATALLQAVRATSGRDQLREVQSDLFGYLMDAERRFTEAGRLFKRGETDDFDVTFWRRACVQLRTVGDAIAWRFLAYHRKTIMLMRRGELSGLMFGKEGTNVEWGLFTEHWDAGEPTLLTGLTTCLRHGDLLVDLGDGSLKLVEAKKNLRNRDRRQDRRARQLIDQINVEARYEGPEGPSWVVETGVPLRSYWSEAGPALDRAFSQGAAAWSPTEGLGVLFLVPSAFRTPSLEEANEMIDAEREAAGAAMGRTEHSIIVPGIHYPYRAGAVAPVSIFPVTVERAAGLVTGQILFLVELYPERLANALRAQGFEAEVVLPPEHGDLAPNIDVLRFSRGEWRGVMHPSGIEPIAVELQDPDSWAHGIAAAAALPERDPRFGVYFCQNEESVWQ